MVQVLKEVIGVIVFIEFNTCPPMSGYEMILKVLYIGSFKLSNTLKLTVWFQIESFWITINGKCGTVKIEKQIN